MIQPGQFAVVRLKLLLALMSGKFLALGTAYRDSD
jgi:hypothetical protein